MPSGRTHAAISAITAIGIYWISFNNNQPEIIFQAIAMGCATGIVITPDLDVDKPVRSHYIILKKFGPVIAKIWRLIWLPYGLVIKHRSWISHMPIIGTLIRASYIFIILLILLWITGSRNFNPLLSNNYFYLLPWVLIGLMISDFIHWATDTLWTRINRSLK